MSYVDKVNEILEEYKRSLGINHDVKIKLRRYKTKSAFVNLKTMTIFINELLLDLGEEVIRYLVLHELIHLKLNSKYHDSEFNKILYSYIPPEKVGKLRELITSKLLLALHTTNKNNIQLGNTESVAIRSLRLT